MRATYAELTTEGENGPGRVEARGERSGEEGARRDPGQRRGVEELTGGRAGKEAERGDEHRGVERPLHVDACVATREEGMDATWHAMRLDA